MEELFKELINQKRQRAGLLAVITGVFMTSQDEDTKRTMAVVLDNVFEEHPVGDDIEKITKDQIQKYLVEEEEDPLRELLRNMFNQK
jgi:outer membrane lipoprotein-sorting protein